MIAFLVGLCSATQIASADVIPSEDQIWAVAFNKYTIDRDAMSHSQTILLRSSRYEPTPRKHYISTRKSDPGAYALERQRPPAEALKRSSDVYGSVIFEAPHTSRPNPTEREHDSCNRCA